MNQAIWYHVDNNQKEWLAKLPYVQFAIMNTMNALTSFSGFQLKTGHSTCIIPPIVPLTENATTEQITAHDIIIHVHLDVQEVQDSLLAAKVC